MLTKNKAAARHVLALAALPSLTHLRARTFVQDGLTPLHHAAAKGDVAGLTQLLSKGADKEATEKARRVDVLVSSALQTPEGPQFVAHPTLSSGGHPSCMRRSLANPILRRRCFQRERTWRLRTRRVRNVFSD